MQELILIKDLGYLFPKVNSKKKSKYGIYKCECGIEFKTRSADVSRGSTKSCGCFRKKTISKTMTTHGLSNTKIYQAFIDMMSRCYKDKNKNFVNYGGRGILICEEWKNDFLSFFNWSLENGYSEGLSIDRINNDGNYAPDNCRWTNRTIQRRNSRKIVSTNKSGFRGVSKYKNSNLWISKIGMPGTIKLLGYFKCRLAAAYAYDNYVVENNLEHTRNF